MNIGADLLVVDDDQVVRGAVRKICAAEGLAIDAAASADAGLELLTRNRYRVVLLDLMLPMRGGMRVLETARRDHRRTPVVMITGYATPGRTVECLRDGAFDVLPKPFDPNELLAVLRRSLAYSDPETRQQLTQPGGLFTLGRRHAWAGIESGDSATLGIGESFRPVLDEMTDIEIAAIDCELAQGDGFATITTRDGLVHRVWAPLGGRVLEANRAWKEDPAGATPGTWVLRVVPTDLENELEQLTRT